MQRHARGRAGRLHRQCRAAQIELEGDAGGRVILVVAQRDVPDARLPVFGMGGELACEVAVGGHAREDTHLAVHAIHWQPGVLERGVGGFQQHALLRIHHLRLTRRVAEEGVVEAVGMVERASGADKVGLRALGAAHACGFQLGVVQQAHAVDAVEQVLPERIDGIRTRHAGGEADHGDACAGIGVSLFSRGGCRDAVRLRSDRH